MSAGEPDPPAGDSAEADGPNPPSWGNMGPRHWSRTRKDANPEALEYLRERSRAPGVAEGGSSRNHYCMECNGVVPLAYDQRAPASKERLHCPHCGAELDRGVRAMFNWVEMDQPPDSDLKAVMLPALLIAVIISVVIGVAWALFGG